MKTLIKNSLILITTLSLAACSYKPIFDPNEKYLAVGEEKAQQDFSICKKEADDYLDQFKAERAAKEAGRTAVIGGVFGTAVGFLSGGNMKSGLVGAAIGAGTGAALGGLSVAAEDNVTPDEMKQRYVSKCLANKGYSVLGWK